jgi:uncharacterized protein
VVHGANSLDKNMEKLKLKSSRYNHFFSYPDGLRLAYNSLSGSILKLNDDMGNEIEAALSGNNRIICQDEILKMLIDLKFLVDDDVNELNIVKYIFKSSTLIEKPIMLTILPTIGCNFGCNYCFEKHIRGLMNSDVQDALLRFVISKLLPKGNSLSIEWFGGEPLLGISVIENLSKRLKDACLESEVQMLPANIITNGYLLDDKMSHRLVNLGITSAQITLDGTPEIHNRRRPLVNGKGSFEKIIENLRNVPDELKIVIRINVDAHNKDCIFDLLSYLCDENLVPRAKPYIARVESYSEECRSSEGDFLSSEQFVEFQNELKSRCMQVGIPWFSSGKPRLNACGFCIVDNINAFVVEPNGKLLKCWAEAGNSSGTEIGHLLKEETWDNLDISPLQRRDPFDDEECCNCKILPACMGGCPKTRENHRLLGYKECPPLRYSLAEDIRNLYSLTSSTEMSKELIKN